VLIALPSLVIFPMLCLEEDRQLEAKLGSRYADFRARRARLVPGVW
jgi:protein-S-isoprenylcysteine O-methyltransferase Ste14